jgi:hypothetical protein
LPKTCKPPQILSKTFPLRLTGPSPLRLAYAKPAAEQFFPGKQQKFFSRKNPVFSAAGELLYCKMDIKKATPQGMAFSGKRS